MHSQKNTRTHLLAQLPFTKMQGLGNDFIVIDELSSKRGNGVSLSLELARKLCDRRFGIGADQILWLKKPIDSTLSARMEILNADGSTAEMCGNGIRAVALYLQSHFDPKSSKFQIETLAGVKSVSIEEDQVTVDMGLARFGQSFATEGEVIQVQGEEFRFFEVNVGNPHAVIFVEDVLKFPVEKIGPLLEKHPRFPERTNVEFVEIRSQNSIQVRVWERGAGITLACGTGACASAVTSLATGRVQNSVEVQLPGGDLNIFWKGPEHPILMKGPAKEVFHGVFFLDELDELSK